jgi:hypothetical protein
MTRELGTIFVRAQGPAKIAGDPFILIAGHPVVGQPCFACGDPFKAGEAMVFISLGPGKSFDLRAAARDNRWYTATAVVVHQACATGVE